MNNKNPELTAGEFLQRIRKKKNLGKNIVNLAKTMGVCVPTLYRRESGSSVISLNDVDIIAQTYKMDSDEKREFIELLKNPPPQKPKKVPPPLWMEILAQVLALEPEDRQKVIEHAKFHETLKK